MIPNPSEKSIASSYAEARERYSALGVDTDEALKRLQTIPISMHCWQGDDVGGFESDAELDGGIAVTGNYPGKARTPEELRKDLEAAFKLLPGRHRLNIHAIYGEFGGRKVARDEISAEHFKGWIDWAKENVQGLDFNPTCFSDPKAADGFTLSHQDAGIRKYWIDHCKACREIGDAMGAALGNPTVVNIWLPDGMKDVPADRLAPRQRLLESLDAVIEAKMENMLDAVECKLFGIGSESYVVGSHEFYMGYAVSRGTLLCLDAGHFHPTEVISDKISSVLTYIDEILLHVSRGVRWDSDHVVLLGDELRAIAEEIVRGDFVERVHIGLDYFDASINRVGAWTIGTRAMIQALLIALLEPVEKLKALEADGDYTGRLALMEAAKALPFGAVWDHYCLANNVPVGISFIDEIRAYEKDVLSKR